MLQERQIANLAFGNGGIWTSSLSNSAATFPFSSWLSAFRLGTIAAFLSVRTPSLLSPQVTTTIYDHRRPCKSDSIATNLTRLFFPAKNSCDQTSDLEIVKEEDAPLRPLGPPNAITQVSESHHS